MKSRPRARIFYILALIAIILLTLTLLPVKEYLARFLTWIHNVGPWGPALLALAYVPATVLFVPGSILTLGAGFIFGVVPGSIAVSLGSTLGAAAAFVIGRTLARDLIDTKVSKNPKFMAIDRAVEKEGFKIVLLTRLSPALPFNLLNYVFSLTKVSFRNYIFASWIGMFPATLMYVYLGSAMQSLAALFAGDTKHELEKYFLFGFGLMATIIATTVVTRTAKKALAETLPD